MNKIIFAALLGWVAEDFSVSNSANPNDPAEPLTSAWVGLGSQATAGLYPSALAIANATFRGVYGGPAAEFIENMTLKWEYRYSDAEDRTEEAGESVNPFYLSFDTPIGGTLYHTVVHTGCVAAEGKTLLSGPSPVPCDEAWRYRPVFNAIWEEFEGLQMKCYMVENGAVVPQKQVKRDENGDEVKDENGDSVMENIILSFYGKKLTNQAEIIETREKVTIKWDGDPPQIDPNIDATIARKNNVFDTAKLLQYKDGTCGAWANFMVNTLKAQGLSASTKGIVPSGRNIDLSDDPLLSLEVTPLVVGQGNSFPFERFWPNHMVVEYGGKIYDPSYGEEYGETTNALQTFSFYVNSIGILYGVTAPDRHLTSGFGVAHVVVKNNPIGLDLKWD